MRDLVEERSGACISLKWPSVTGGGPVIVVLPIWVTKLGKNFVRCAAGSERQTGRVFRLHDKAFRLVVRYSFVFASSNCDWVRLMTLLILTNHSYCFQKQMKIEL